MILPGGYGAVYEFFTAIQGVICKEIQKPIILYNSCGYYQKLIAFLKEAQQEGFISNGAKNYFCVANSIEEVEDRLGDVHQKSKSLD